MELQNIKLNLYKKVYNHIEKYIRIKGEKFIINKANSKINEGAYINFGNKGWRNIENIVQIINNERRK